MKIGVLHSIESIDSDVDFKRVSINEARVEVKANKGAQELEDKEVIKTCPCDLSGLDLNHAQKEDLTELLRKHSQVFSADDLGYTETVRHKIRTTGDIPVTQPYRLQFLI